MTPSPQEDLYAIGGFNDAYIMDHNERPNGPNVMAHASQSSVQNLAFDKVKSVAGPTSTLTRNTL